MILKHVALVCGSEKKSDAFYEHLLGLKKQAPKILPEELSAQIFNRASPYPVINYTGDTIHFEIFIDDRINTARNDIRIEHVCIEVEDLEGFLAKCRAAEVKILQIPKGDRIVTFIRDYDGNLFEIKAMAV